MNVGEVRVCLNNRGKMRYSCMASGSRETLKTVKEKFGDSFKVKPWTCMGNCQEGPMICVIDDVGREHFISKGNLEELEQMVGGHGN